MNDIGVISATLYKFYSGFGVRAWSEEDVPTTEDDGTELKPPYITFSIVCPEWRESALHQARIWTRSESNEEAFAIAGRVLDAIGEGVTLEAVNGRGYVTLDPGTPLAQKQPMDEDDIRVVYINLILGAITARSE